MIRNLKTLGSAFVAVLAMSATITSVAAAFEFHSASAPTTLTGSQATKNVFTIPGAGSVECEEVNLHGSQAFSTSSEMVLHPTFGKCKAFGFATTHVNSTGCDYRMLWPTEWGSVGPHVPVSFSCSLVEPLRITPTVFGSSVCTVTIGNQFTSGVADLDNSNPISTLTFTWTLTKIKHSAGCGASEASDGTYAGSALVKGGGGAIWVG